MALRKTLYLLTVIMIIKIQHSSYAQVNPQRAITLHVQNMPLEQLIAKLQTEYNIKIVYGSDNINVHQAITIQVTSISLTTFLDTLCKKANLTYRMAEDYVILQRQRQKQKPKTKPPVRTIVEVISEKMSEGNIQERLVGDTLQLQPVHIEVKDVFVEQDKIQMSVPGLDSQKIQSPVITPLVTKDDHVNKGRRKNITRYTWGTLVSYDQVNFHFNSLQDKSQEYETLSGGAFGMKFSASLKKYSSLSVGFLYSRKGFAYHRNYKILLPNDPVSIPDVTSLDLRYFEMPVSLTFQFVRGKKLGIGLVPGIDMIMLLHQEEQTTYLTQGEPQTSHFKKNTCSFVWGPLAGVKLEYPIKSMVKMFLEPQYIRFVRPCNSTAMHDGCDVFRLQAGIEVQLNTTRSKKHKT